MAFVHVEKLLGICMKVKHRSTKRLASANSCCVLSLPRMPWQKYEHGSLPGGRQIRPGSGPLPRRRLPDESLAVTAKVTE